ncbi:MAG: divalent metal cation transporter [Acidobacteria bacterium]|nr:divalent metal cation transporter [Acidobacteriota bacterium]MCA1652191.1 divalent metal cation transporter [Acidobacteriota bacterium]
MTETDSAERREAAELIRRYPLAEALAPELLANELAEVERLRDAPLLRKFLGYFRLTGPGFMGSALTLGAGTMTSAMLMGTDFGFKTLWIVWLSVGLGMFMIAAAARFTCRGGFRVIPAQNRYHGVLVGSLLTGLLGVAFVAIVFNFAQYSLASHLIESLAALGGVRFPRQVNWIVLVPLTSWLTLLYGSSTRGVARVERFMKACVLLMFVGLAATLMVVGVAWREFFRGLVVPWLPRGLEGITLFVAYSTAAIGVMDWVMFHYTSHARGWGPKQETLARFDLTFGFFLPFVVINLVIISVFAGTLHKLQLRPESAPELAAALAPALGAYWSQVFFYVGLLAAPITTTIGMSIAGAIAIHEAFGWTPDTASWRWKVSALLPQIGFLGVWYPRPLWLIVLIGAFLSLTQNFAAWSFYLLLNDRSALGEDRCRSFGWNLGVALNITLVNCVAIVYIMSRLNMWPE